MHQITRCSQRRSHPGQTQQQKVTEELQRE